MSRFLPMTLAFGLAFAATATQAAGPAPVDLTGVDAVVVTGGGVVVDIGTDPGRPLQAVLDQADDCAATMQVDGHTLTVDIQRSSWWGHDCRPVLTVNLRPGADIALRPAAVSATLDGHFGAVRVAAQAAQLSLTGQTRTIDVSARALKADLRLISPEPAESVRLNADAGDITLAFRRGTPVSYTVDARFASVDSTVPASVGGHPLVAISGNFIKARIGFED
jgi:hypothetical protein